MNSKIPLRVLAERFADQSNISVEEAQNFIKCFFQQVADGLYAGEDIEIDGFGKFITVNNLNNPIHFLPSNQLSDELNEPFALFAPVEIHDMESVEALKEIDAEFESPQTEVFAAESTPETADSDKSDSDKMDSAVSEPVNEDSTQTLEPQIDSSEFVETNSDNESEEIPAMEDTELLPPPLPEEKDDAIAEAHQTAVDSDAPAEEMTVVDIEPTGEVSTPTVIPESEEQTHEYYVHRTSRFGLGFFLGLIVGLLIGAIALACYAIYFVNTGIPLF